MPNSKSRKVAARQAQLRQRAKHKARPKIPIVPQYIPPTTLKEAALAENTLEVESTQVTSPNTAGVEPIRRTQPGRQDRVTELSFNTSSLKTELLRIGTVATVVVGALVVLRFGTNLGA